MREISVKTKDNKIKINTNDIIEILNLKSDFESIVDISDTLNQKKIFAYDCILDREVLDLELLEEIVNELHKRNDVNASVRLDDIVQYIQELSDEVETDIEDEYNIENITCHFNLYNVETTTNEFRFVFLISFDEKVSQSIVNLSEIIGKRQLLGESKYYN
ncbi:MAG: hypothetical protein R3Y64_07500 [Peptostreptococcaceae bacterium]